MTNVLTIWGYIQAGIIFQLLILVSPYVKDVTIRDVNKSIISLLSSVIFSIVGILYICNGAQRCNAWQLEDYVVLAIVLFNLGFFARNYSHYKKYLYPYINEYRVYSLSLLVVYVLLLQESTMLNNLAFFVMPIVLVIFLLNLVHIHTPLIVKTLLYVWFMICNLILFFSQSVTIVIDIFQKSNLDRYTLLEYIFLGMISIYLFINIMGIMEFWPLPGKGQSWRNRRVDIKNHVHVLFKKYHDIQSPVLFTLLFTILIGVVLFIDRFIVHNSVIAIAVILTVTYIFDQVNLRNTLSTHQK